MKSIKVYAADEIIDDIKATAQKVDMSASGYLVGLHLGSVVNPAFDDRFDHLSVRNHSKVGMAAKSKKTIQDIRDEVDEKARRMRTKFPESMTGFSGSYSKEQQTGKK